MRKIRVYLAGAAFVALAAVLIAGYSRPIGAQDPGQRPRPQNVLVVNPATQPVPVAGAVNVNGSVQVGNFPSAFAASRQNWEYMVIASPANTTPSQTQARYNDLGGQGWEFVGVTVNGEVFKRPR